jgi:predicted helicase
VVRVSHKIRANALYIDLGAPAFRLIKSDAAGNWLGQTENDFETFIPIATKQTKTAKTKGQERVIFKLFSLGVVTARDEWDYATCDEQLKQKLDYLIGAYNADVKRLKKLKHLQNILTILSNGHVQ